MVEERNRKTLAETVSWDGVGLHSGVLVQVKAHPGENGIVFRYQNERIEAIPENVSDTSRCTCLGSIHTVEHLMSALAALEITDLEVDLSANELPSLDGSSLVYYKSLKNQKFEALPADEIQIPFSRIFFQEGDISIAISRGNGHWGFRFESGDRWPHAQAIEFENVLKSYESEIAPARTFAFEEEVEQIQRAGLAKGLDETSALILGKSGYLNLAHFEDEPVRHKLLDLIGDLALARIPIRFLNVQAIKSGHRTNVLAAKKLRLQMKFL